jgi:cysteine desulfurase / selenocysteine lyase
MTPEEVSRLRQDFPQLARRFRGKAPVYLDSACTALQPSKVIDAVADFSRNGSTCHGRSNHRFGREATEAYVAAREAVARFVSAKGPKEVVFTRNATEGINLVASSLGLKAGDAVVTTDMEHNSNLLPWQRHALVRGVRHSIVTVDPKRGLDLALLRAELKRRPRLVSVFHVSNFTGIELPIREICKEAHRAGALVLVDGAQSVLSRKIDVHKLGADFFVFSLHKMMGPPGVGVLWGREEALTSLVPFNVGGDTVEDVTWTDSAMSPIPERFEAGVANVAGAVGARAAVEYVTAIGPERIHEHTVALNRLATKGLRAMKEVQLIGPEDPAQRGSILNFYVEGLDSKGLARVLDERASIMVRYGKHCAHAWYNGHGVPESVRVSFGAYNTEEEVAYLLRTLDGVIEMIR